MKRILQDQTKHPIRVFETDYGYLVKSRCGWPHRSKARIYVTLFLFCLVPTLFFSGLALPESSPLKVLGNYVVVITFLIFIITLAALYQESRTKEKDTQSPEKPPEEKFPNIALKFKIDAQKMRVTAWFGVEQKLTAPIEPSSLFSLDGDRFRYITGDINTSKFEVQIAPRKRLTIVGYRRDTIGEMIDLARTLNHLLDLVRETEPLEVIAATVSVASSEVINPMD